MLSRPLRGRCYCGAVQLEVEDALVSAFYCHCSRCRQQTGSAFASIGCIEVEKFSIRSGEDALSRSEETPEGHAALCAFCHARIYAMVRQRRFVHIPLGILADVPSVLPSFHINVASKAPWYRITDDLPQHDVLPP